MVATNPIVCLEVENHAYSHSQKMHDMSKDLKVSFATNLMPHSPTLRPQAESTTLGNGIHTVSPLLFSFFLLVCSVRRAGMLPLGQKLLLFSHKKVRTLSPSTLGRKTWKRSKLNPSKGESMKGISLWLLSHQRVLQTN